MGMEMRLEARMSQRLVMTPMLQQAIKLLPMTRLQLVQAIRSEIEENPLLEELAEAEPEENQEEDETDLAPSTEQAPGERSAEDAPGFEEQTSLGEEKEQDSREDIDWDAYVQEELYEGSTGEGYENKPSLENTLRQKDGLEDHLLWQLNMAALTEEERRLGEIIIGNLNNDGYLATDFENLCNEAGVTADEMEDGLALVQSFDPHGVASRDLRECLLLQVYANGFKGMLVEDLVKDHISNLEERNFPKLAKLLDVDIEDIVDAVMTIREFDPKPGLLFNEEDTHYISPDIFVVKVDGEYQVYLNDDDVPRLRINPVYHAILKNKKEDQKQTREYIDNKFRSALWMIKSIEQRRQTMLKVGRSLCKFQRGFLDNGLQYLKPLVLKDVADDIKMHESTISRVTTNKYIHTPQGLFELKYFFHSSVGSYLGNDMSSVRVKEMVKNLVKEEDPTKPLTDDQLVKLLQAKDVKIARRTVTKYRKELQIPSTPKRRKLYL